MLCHAALRVMFDGIHVTLDEWTSHGSKNGPKYGRLNKKKSVQRVYEFPGLESAAYITKLGIPQSFCSLPRTQPRPGEQ
jgi:hypothetical protein